MDAENKATVAWKETRVWAVVTVIYLVGLVGFMVPAWHGVFVWLIPANILFAFVVLLLGEDKFTPQKLLLFTVCFVFGYVYELAGTTTGIIFGAYTYGGGLGWAVFGVPVLIGLNWFFMVYTSLSVAAQITQHRLSQVVLAPAFMVLYDCFLEPFAVKTGMWQWTDGIVPLQNYLAWYLGGITLCAFAVYGRFNFKNRFAVWLFVVQMAFFILLFVYDGLFR